mmetsp:Transcript_11032/g.24826  ORF Transcript_11032/g.24826 Transcript_11032/m.24826 type:complete len:328 (-) Transcript_11032:77-1060(-)
MIKTKSAQDIPLDAKPLLLAAAHTTTTTTTTAAAAALPPAPETEYHYYYHHHHQTQKPSLPQLMLYDLPLRKEIVGHRGLGANSANISPKHQENTIESFHAAHELGAVWVECDVQTLNCGTHVLYHDEFATTKEGTLMRLKDATHHDLSLTRLEDALLNSAPSINFNLEIKYHGKSDDEVARMATQIAEAVHALAPKRRICFSCFHPAACIALVEHMHTNESKHGILFLTEAGSLDGDTYNYHDSLHEAMRFASNNGIHGVVSHASAVLASPEPGVHAHSLGLALYTFGKHNNDVRLAVTQYCTMGVTALIVDDVATVARSFEQLSY